MNETTCFLVVYLLVQLHASWPALKAWRENQEWKREGKREAERE